MSKSKWEEYKEKNGVTPLDLLNPKTKRSSKDLASERLAICKACPELIKLTTQCKKCGCFMKAKTTIEAATCPLGKW
jgi:ribosomal protein L32